MSRTRLGFFLMLSIAASGKAPAQTAESALARYHVLTMSQPDCSKGSRGSDEIIVCARRDADRFRVPLVEQVAGDPEIQNVPGERERLQYKRTPCQNYELFLVGCGMVGVSVSTRLNGNGIEYRKLAD